MAPVPPPPARTAWEAGSLLLIALSLGLHLAATLAAEPLQSANDRSRWATVRALAERGSFRIDPYEHDPRWSTIDQVQVGGNLYSTKPAPLPVAAAAVLLPVEAVTGWDLAERPAAATRAVLVVLNLLPFAAALWAVRGLLTDFARTDFGRFLALGALAFATPLSAFLPVFNNHTLAACCAALALAPLVRIWNAAREPAARARAAAPARFSRADTLAGASGSRADTLAGASGSRGGPLAGASGSGGLFAAAGFFAALTACNELPAGLFGLLALAVCWRADRRRTVLAFAPAAAVPLLAFAAATLAQTGSLKPFYLSYGSETYEYVRRGVPSYWTDPTGLDAARDGFWAYLLHCTVGHHGVFSLTPVLLLTAWSAGRAALAVLGRAAGRAGDQHPLTACAAAAGLLSAAVFGFYLTRTENYNYGGTSVALRWLVWLAPLWAVALVPLADRFAGRRRFRAAAAGLLALSAASAWVDAPNPWRHPWLFRVLSDAGLIDYAEPRPAFAAPRFAWFDLPAPAEGETIGATWHAATPAGGVRTLTLAAGRTGEHSTLAVNLDGRRWTGRLTDAPAGPPTAWFAPGEGDERPPDWVLDLLRGIPARKPYNAGRMEYLFTPLRPDAFACRRRAVQVPVGPRRYRTDAWVSDAVPFGAVRWERTVTGVPSGRPLAREVWERAAPR